MSDLVQFSAATLDEGKVLLGNTVKGTLKKGGSFKGKISEIRRVGKEAPRCIIMDGKGGCFTVQFENVKAKAVVKSPEKAKPKTGNPFIDKAKAAA